MDRHSHKRRNGIHRTTSILKGLLKIKKNREASSPAIPKAVMPLTASVNGLGGPLGSVPAARATKAIQTRFHAFKSVFSLHKPQNRYFAGYLKV